MIGLDASNLFAPSLGPARSSGTVVPLARRLRSGHPDSRPRWPEAVPDDPRPHVSDPAPEGAPAKAEPHPWNAPRWWWR